MARRLGILGTVLALAAMSVALLPAFSASAVGTGNQGCTPGYWKNHPESWEEYSPVASSTLPYRVRQVFSSTIPQANWTLLQALQGGGGSGVDGARQILLRAATAALLNAAHDGLGYPLRRYSGPPAPSGFVSVVRGLLQGNDRNAMLSYASYLDRLNNSGCPLS